MVIVLMTSVTVTVSMIFPLLDDYAARTLRRTELTGCTVRSGLGAGEVVKNVRTASSWRVRTGWQHAPESMACMRGERLHWMLLALAFTVYPLPFGETTSTK